MIRDRTRSGLDAARRRGARIGRPPVSIDVERALALKAQGVKMADIAREFGVGASTVRRELAKASRHGTSHPPDRATYADVAAE
jgi:DNA invertase Pin-like site-specific DNA recombinase